MRNLAGLPEEAANEAVTRELEQAGIPLCQFDPEHNEVKAIIGGVIEVGGYEIRLDRRWVYWSAHVHRMSNQPEDKAPHLPETLAIVLNDAPHLGERAYYSGPGPGLGTVVRADGYAGGQPSSMLTGGVHCWHIDTHAGLTAFAQWLKANLATTTHNAPPGVAPKATEMSPFKYDDEIPPEYRCDGCGAFGVRLYRDYQTLAPETRLLCTACAERADGKGRKANPDHPDQIGWMVAAVPTEDGSTFWGFTSVPDAGVRWWRGLPAKIMRSARGS